MSKGIFITFEGGEGSGKTTQLEKLSEFLSTRALEHVVTYEPGGTKLGVMLRALLLEDNSSLISPMTELFLFCADRAQHLQEIIAPALNAGKIVISDRFTDATIAYQGYGRGLDLETIHKLNKLTTAGMEPDITFLLDIPAEEGLLRVARRATAAVSLNSEGIASDRFETEAICFHQRVRAGYLDLANTAPQRFITINAALDVQSIAFQIQKTLLTRLGR